MFATCSPAGLAQLDRQVAKLVALRAAVSELHHVAAESNPEECAPDRIGSYV